MTKLKQISLSNCCNAPVKVEWGDDFGEESKLKEPPRGVTIWNTCMKCKKACSIKGASI